MCKKYKNDHNSVTELMWDLHWLPIRARVPVAYLGFHFGGGGSKYFFVKVGVFAWREAFARGVRGHAPPKKFLKMVRFGEYFAKIL